MKNNIFKSVVKFYNGDNHINHEMKAELAKQYNALAFDDAKYYKEAEQIMTKAMNCRSIRKLEEHLHNLDYLKDTFGVEIKEEKKSETPKASIYDDMIDELFA